MQQFSDGLSSLLAECQQNEAILDKVRQFAHQGGQHRISIAVDHPDPEVAAAVVAISQRHMPCDVMVHNLLAHAENNVERSKHKILNFTVGHFAPPMQDPPAAQAPSTDPTPPAGPTPVAVADEVVVP